LGWLVRVVRGRGERNGKRRVACGREKIDGSSQPLLELFGDVVAEGDLRDVVSIRYREMLEVEEVLKGLDVLGDLRERRRTRRRVRRREA